MSERKAWLEKDLPHLFDDVGIDKSGYAEVVEFRDPITSVSSLLFLAGKDCCFLVSFRMQKLTKKRKEKLKNIKIQKFKNK